MSKLEIFKTETQEVFAEKNGVTVTVTEWANHEGLNVLVQDKRTTVLQGSLRWEELELLNAATAMVKA